MKIFYLTLFLVGLSFLANAQLRATQWKLKNEQLLKQFNRPAKVNSIQPKSNLRVAAACGFDTVEYIFQKRTYNDDYGINFINLVNANGEASTVGQFFNCQQAMTIAGFYFIAVKLDTADVTPVNVTCSIYKAAPDSTIVVKLGRTLDTPIGSVSVPVDTTGLYGNFELRFAKFATPVVVNQPFIVAITNPSTVDQVLVITSDFSDSVGTKPRRPDGFQEWLLSITGRILNNNLVSYPSRYFGIDGDLLVAPVVKYDVVADFSVDKTTLSVGENLTITNLSSPVIRDPFYNYASFIGQDSLSFYWNFGDTLKGVPNARNLDAGTFTKSYDKPGKYTISLSDSVYGYYQTCGATKSIAIDVIGAQAVNDAFEGKHFNLYPNPGDGEFTLSSEALNISTYEIVVTDLAGSEILRSKTSNSPVTTFSLKNQSKGMYLLKLINEKELIVKQIIIK